MCLRRCLEVCPTPETLWIAKSFKWDQSGQKDSFKGKYANLNPYAKAKFENEILLLLSSLAAQNKIIYFFLRMGEGGKLDNKHVIVCVSFTLHPQECCYSAWSQCCHHSFSPTVHGFLCFLLCLSPSLFTFVHSYAKLLDKKIKL